MSSQACVKNSVHGGWCILAFLWAIIPPGRPPLGRHHPPPPHFLFICSFQQKFCKFIGWCAPLESWRPLGNPGSATVLYSNIFTALKRCLLRLCFYTCLSFCSRGLSACWDTITSPHSPPPPVQSMLGDTVNKRAVCILLEFKLVNLFCFIQGINLPEQ